jgi:hypothetical protein
MISEKDYIDLMHKQVQLGIKQPDICILWIKRTVKRIMYSE